MLESLLNALGIPVKVVLTHEKAQLPEYKKEGDAGADVRSVEEVTIHIGQTKMIDLGLKIELLRGWEMQVRSRSGLARKHGIIVSNAPGTIDSGYRGPCMVILHNLSDKPYTVKVGERIAQFVLKRAPVAKFEQVEELGVSERGEDGLGSTGKS